jgi:phosphoribosylformimino-5-aminoimidazole carboxamide ribotide isomerase
MRIIPAIDLYEGKCVRLKEGDYSTMKEYSDDPAAMAARFVQAGFSEIHVVDLEGARLGRVCNWDALQGIAAVPGVRMQAGGGLRTEEEVRQVLDLGASKAVLGSVAARNPSLASEWAQEYGAARFCIAVDVKNGALVSQAWQAVESDSVDSVVETLCHSGFRDFLCTDVGRDGMLGGPNLPLYRVLSRRFPNVRWIASGGVASRADVDALRQTGVDAAVIGKALYEGLLKLDDLRF